MSKTKAKKLYEVTSDAVTSDGIITSARQSVIVLARHEKGARSIAGEYLDNITASASVAELPASLAPKAANHKEKSGVRL